MKFSSHLQNSILAVLIWSCSDTGSTGKHLDEKYKASLNHHSRELASPRNFSELVSAFKKNPVVVSITHEIKQFELKDCSEFSSEGRDENLFKFAYVCSDDVTDHKNRKIEFLVQWPAEGINARGFQIRKIKYSLEEQ